MKKLFLAVALFIGVATFTQAQDLNKALGIRFGWGAELSYQHPLSGNTRLEADLGLLGWEHNDFLLSGIFQWVIPIQGGFNWYVGLGPQVGSVYYKTKSGLGLGAAGQVGLEYNIPSAPIQLSLDWRPGFFFVPSGYPFDGRTGGFGIRYRF